MKLTGFLTAGALIGALFVTGCVTHVPEGGVTSAKNSTGTATAKSGKPNALVSSAGTDLNCKTIAYPVVTITTKPKHGKAWVASTISKAKFAAGDPRTKCNGRPARGVAVWYQSTAGFIGADYVSWIGTVGSTVSHGSSTITVVK